MNPDKTQTEDIWISVLETKAWDTIVFGKYSYVHFETDVLLRFYKVLIKYSKSFSSGRTFHQRSHFEILDFNVFCQIALSGHNILPFITFYKYIMLIMFIFSASQLNDDL